MTLGRSPDRGDYLPLLRANWLNRKPASTLKQNHLFQPLRFSKLVERNQTWQTLNGANIHHEPRRRVHLALRIEVRILGVECRRVGISTAHHLGDSGNARRIGARVIDE